MTVARSSPGVTALTSALVLIALLLAVACPGCGGHGNAGSVPPPVGAGLRPAQGRSETGPYAPDADNLHAYLYAELARLGKDPSNTASSAPTGADNAVFDLSAEIIDPDGEGGDPPTGINLSWTEQLVGDYDQNGLVNASDLTPLGANWQAEVDYDNPSQHGGFAYWPSGDPDDGGTGSENWRLARIDGNRDDQLYQYDITPIAVHWQERLSGYRIYRKGPLDLVFKFLPNTEDAQSMISVKRPEVAAGNPVRYAFMDDEEGSGAMPEGIYAYYIAPYDSASDREGPVSAVYVISTTGVEPQAPVAQLTVTPDFAGAPAEIKLDASESYDEDGTIAAFHWDFDADGVIDWVSTDPVPETSSAGKVGSITPDGNGLVEVRYRHGSATWYFPSVIVEDDLGLTSLPAYAQLGLSGWEGEIVGDKFGTVDVGFEILAITMDTNSRQIIAAGSSPEGGGGDSQPWLSQLPRGMYFARRLEAADWHHELIMDENTPVWAEYLERHEHGSIDWMEFFWQDNGEPAVLMRSRPSGFSFDGRLYTALRQPGGGWHVDCIYEGQRELTSNRRGVIGIDIEHLGAEMFVVLTDEQLEGDASGGGVYHYYVTWYDHGAVTVEDTGAQFISQVVLPDNRHLLDIAVDSQHEAICIMNRTDGLYPAELWARRRMGPDSWVDERLDDGDLTPTGGDYYWEQCIYGEQDNLLVTAYMSGYELEDTPSEWRLYEYNSGGLAIKTIWDKLGGSTNAPLYRLDDSTGLAYFDTSEGTTYSVRLEDSGVLIENCWQDDEWPNVWGTQGFWAGYNGQGTAALIVSYDDPPTTYIAQAVMWRIDPRYN